MYSILFYFIIIFTKRANIARKEKEKATGAAASASMKPPSSSAETSLNDDNDDNDVLSDMVGSCILYPNDYWNYQLCHRTDVRQSHSEMTEKGAVKTHDFSLGSFENSTILYSSGYVEHISSAKSREMLHQKTSSYSSNSRSSADVVVKIVDYYYGGQLCHETNRNRQTEVHIQCCHPQAAKTYGALGKKYESQVESSGESDIGVQGQGQSGGGGANRRHHRNSKTAGRQIESPWGTSSSLHTTPVRSVPMKLPERLEAELLESRRQRQKRNKHQQTNLGSSSDVQEFTLPYDLRLVSELDICVYKLDVCNNNLCRNMDINVNTDASSSATTAKAARSDQQPQVQQQQSQSQSGTGAGAGSLSNSNSHSFQANKKSGGAGGAQSSIHQEVT